ncbi:MULTISPECIES: hypothetical protein [Aquimarina]|uniref:hypothetical protein n=1 Tax=Aquimarina TaxID=290174 RepID=UPI0003FE759E|nr:MULTISPECIES: hypothetical protein [Aquimarina]
MKAKSFLLNILFFILAFTFVGCEADNIEDNSVENVKSDDDVDLKMIDKEEVEEPDDRDS